mgnify:FL=1
MKLTCSAKLLFAIKTFAEFTEVTFVTFWPLLCEFNVVVIGLICSLNKEPGYRFFNAAHLFADRNADRSNEVAMIEVLYN